MKLTSVIAIVTHAGPSAFNFLDPCLIFSPPAPHFLIKIGVHVKKD